MRRLLQLALLLTIAAPAWATAYYGANAAGGGSDSNNGTSTGTPWLTPNHSVNCGDTITFAAGTYAEGNFDATFGLVTGSGHCFAIAQCAVFDGCLMVGTDGSAQVWVSKSHWMIKGFEVQNPNATSGNACFKASPLSAANIIDIAFVDDIANGCPLGGFVTSPYYSNPSGGHYYGVDYVALIADIAYNAAQSNSECASGSSIFEPVNNDTISGTHIYLSQNFSWNNVDPSGGCGGTAATDGEGIIIDSPNGQVTGIPCCYTGQTVIDNAIAMFNGTEAVETYASSVAPIYVEHVTGWHDGVGTGLTPEFCAEFLNQYVNTPYNSNVQYLYNLAKTGVSTCATSTYYAFTYGYITSQNRIDANWGYDAAGHNYYCWSTCNSFSPGSANLFGTDPDFANAPSSTPAAPSCSGAASVIACMAPLIADMVPTASGASVYGYQLPQVGIVYDPLYPQVLCSYSAYLVGLVSQGCLVGNIQK